MSDGTGVVQFFVSFRGKKFELTLPTSQTLEELGSLLEKTTGASPRTQKLIPPRAKKLKDKGLPPPTAFHPADAAHKDLTLTDVGIVQGATVMLLAATEEDLRSVTPPGDATRDLIGFEEEDVRARRRHRAHPANDDLAKRLPKGPYTFGSFRTLSLPLIELTPPPSKALQLMYRLASDPGIVAIMAKHRWAVGIMTELAPEGYVGISPKCLLGFNKNHGEEISLRLRTDDLRGFRKYLSIRKTLLHELAHMVHSEHDEKFHALDKQLNNEVEALDWTRGPSHMLGRTPRRLAGEDESDDSWSSADEGVTGVMAATRLSSGQRLGGGSETPILADPRASAAIAALQRLSPPTTPPPRSPEPTPPEPTLPTPTLELPAVAPPGNPPAVLMSSLRHLDGSPEPTPPEPTLPQPIPTLELPAVAPLGNPPAVPMSSLRHLDVADVAIDRPPQPETITERSFPESQPPRLTFRGEVSDDTDTSADRDGESMEPMAVDDAGGRFLGGVEGVGPPGVVGLPEAQGDAVGGPGGEGAGFVEEEGMDPDVARMFGAAAETSDRVRAAITRLKIEAGADRALVAMQTVATILRNAMADPQETKYRRVRKTNPVFQQRAGAFQGAIDILNVAGFNQGSPNDVSGDHRDYLVLTRDDPGLLWLVCSTLEDCMA